MSLLNFWKSGGCVLLLASAACGGSSTNGPNGGLNSDGSYPTDDIGTAARAGDQPGQRINNFSFYGYLNTDPNKLTDPSGAPQRISLQQFYDPTGSAYKVIHVVGSSVWCAPCNQETENLAAGDYKEAAAAGIVVLQALLDGSTMGTGATTADLQSWVTGPRVDDTGSKFKTPINFTTVLDPNLQNLGSFFAAGAVPFNIVIDARSMEILYSEQKMVNLADIKKWVDWVNTHGPK